MSDFVGNRSRTPEGNLNILCRIDRFHVLHKNGTIRSGNSHLNIQ